MGIEYGAFELEELDQNEEAVTEDDQSERNAEDDDSQDDTIVETLMTTCEQQKEEISDLIEKVAEINVYAKARQNNENMLQGFEDQKNDLDNLLQELTKLSSKPMEAQTEIISDSMPIKALLETCEKQKDELEG